MRFTIWGRPATAKNGATLCPIRRGAQTIHVMVKKPALRRWEKYALKQITGDMKKMIDQPVNIQCLIWTQENRRADLVGYLQAVDDMLVHAGVLVDDSAVNPAIVVGHDGSRVMGKDAKNPRIEIEIVNLV